MNECYICQAEAIARCYTCGRLICGKHGGENCIRCNTSVVAGDPPGRHVSAERLGPSDAKHGWWRPQEAEEFKPPACYACGALARRICRNCGSRYCREHAGPSDLCIVCGRSARMGLVVFLVAIGMMLAIILFGCLSR
jgi:hypothetical protein